MKLEIDFKVTTWERATINPENYEEVLNAIKTGKISSGEELANYLRDKGDANISFNILPYCTEQMTVEENDGCSTIEVVQNEQTIWDNAEE
jgi:hypothetical protein